MYLSILKLSENDNNAGENNSVAICNHYDCSSIQSPIFTSRTWY